MSNTYVTSSSSSGLGVAGALGVLFVALKLLGVIAWPWVWVLAPFWIPMALVLVFLLILAIGFFVALALD